MHSRNSRIFRTCAACGAELSAEESCHCTQPLPRDGLRASCPFFHHRGNFRGRAYIVCRMAEERGFIKTPFESTEERNLVYMHHCCAGLPCPVSARELERYAGRCAP